MCRSASGLSSSAALEVAAGYALLATAGIAIDLTALALTQPARRERLRRHALRHHGPVHRLSRGGRTRAPDRLPVARFAPRADRPEGQAGDLQHHGPSRPRRQRIQRPPPRLRARRGTPLRGSAGYSRPSRRQPGRPRASCRPVAGSDLSPLPSRRHRERPDDASRSGPGGRRPRTHRAPHGGVACEHARRFRDHRPRGRPHGRVEFRRPRLASARA